MSILLRMVVAGWLPGLVLGLVPSAVGALAVVVPSGGNAELCGAGCKAELCRTSAETGAGEAATWSYRLTVIPGTPARVECALELREIDPALDVLHLEMIEGFAFARLPEPLLLGELTASAGGEPLAVERARPYAWRVPLAGRRDVTVRWVVPLTHRDHETVRGRDEYEYPYLAEDHGMLATAVLVVAPTNLTLKTARIQLDLPAGWRALAPWRAVGPTTFETDQRRSLVNDYVAIGAWTEREVRVGDFHCRIAIAPGQEALAQSVSDPIARIVEREIALFDRPMTGEYLFLFGRSPQRGLGGSPKTRSMTLYIEPGLVARAGGHIHHLIAHEFFHLWNPGEIAAPGELRWVTEGFTDYFAFRVSAELGLISWDEFARTLAERMRGAEENELRGRSSLVDAGGEAFFGGGLPYDLVYGGGLLVGAWLDRSLRRLGDGRTLEGLMRRYLNDPARRGSPPTLETFLALVADYGNAALASRLRELVITPWAFDAVAVFGEAGLVVERRAERKAPPLRANLDGARIVDLDPTSWSARFGLKTGDVLIEINGQPVTSPGEAHAAWRQAGDAMTVTLRRGDQELTLRELLPDVVEFRVPVEEWSKLPGR